MPDSFNLHVYTLDILCPLIPWSLKQTEGCLFVSFDRRVNVAHTLHYVLVCERVNATVPTYNGRRVCTWRRLLSDRDWTAMEFIQQVEGLWQTKTLWMIYSKEFDLFQLHCLKPFWVNLRIRGHICLASFLSTNHTQKVAKTYNWSGGWLSVSLSSIKRNINEPRHRCTGWLVPSSPWTKHTLTPSHIYQAAAGNTHRCYQSTAEAGSLKNNTEFTLIWV